MVPGGRPEVLRWWWLAGLLMTFNVRGFDAPDAAGVAMLQAPFRIWCAAFELLVGALTVVVLTRLRDDQARAFADQAMRVPAT